MYIVYKIIVQFFILNFQPYIIMFLSLLIGFLSLSMCTMYVYQLISHVAVNVETDLSNVAEKFEREATCNFPDI